jgi:tetratricopeptide (TPR) repeat protein
MWSEDAAPLIRVYVCFATQQRAAVTEGGDFVFEMRPENEFLSAQSSQLSSDAIALNNQLDTLQPKPAAAKPAPVVVANLQGEAQKIQLPKAVPPSQRQLAQRANDRGLQLYKEKRYAEAEAAFTEALRQRPDFALAANNLGFIYFRQQKYPEAARWFENTLSMDRSRAIAYLNLGDAWLKAGEPAKAKTAFQTYLEIAANGAGAGHARQMLGEN